MTENFPLSLIIVLPLLGAVLNLLFGRRLGNTFVSLVACSAVAGAALVATKAVLLVASATTWQATSGASRGSRGAPSIARGCARPCLVRCRARSPMS